MRRYSRQAQGEKEAIDKNLKTLEKSREKMQQGIQGESDIWSKISTQMAKSARDDIKKAKEMYYSVPQEVRDYEAYNYAGYKMGGEVKVRGQGAVMKSKKCKIY